jgi:hypothetical protein
MVMTRHATMTTEQIRIDGVEVRRVTVDCPHGTSTADLINGRLPGAPDADTVGRILAARHEASEHCGCALPLLAPGARA